MVAQALEVTCSQQMTMRPTQSLVMFAELLALPAIELESRVESELEENPALELAEDTGCALCGGTGCRGRCRDFRGADIAPGPGGHEGDVAEAVQQLAVVPTPREALLLAVRPLVNGDETLMAEYLVGSLDDRGYLETDLATLAGVLCFPVERLAHVLDRLREVGPPGIGAVDLRECLLLQLDDLAGTGDGDPLARLIVDTMLPDLARATSRSLARRLGVPVEEVDRARAFLKARLRPYPGCGPRDEPADGERPRPPALRPDVVVTGGGAEPGEYEAVVLQPFGRQVVVSPAYRDLVASRLPAEERRHVRMQVRRAETFLTALERRSATLLQISQLAVQEQSAFVASGARAIRPLTRSRVATMLGLHESTVSRATADKYAELPSGRVIPLADFFDSSQGVREVLRGIISAEPTPLSDQELSRRLAAQGYRVARRTVTKYRSRLGVPSAGLRR